MGHKWVIGMNSGENAARFAPEKNIFRIGEYAPKGRRWSQ
jgi:hypothetical protein